MYHSIQETYTLRKVKNRFYFFYRVDNRFQNFQGNLVNRLTLLWGWCFKGYDAQIKQLAIDIILEIAILQLFKNWQITSIVKTVLFKLFPVTLPKMYSITNVFFKTWNWKLQFVPLQTSSRMRPGKFTWLGWELQFVRNGNPSQSLWQEFSKNAGGTSKNRLHQGHFLWDI